MKKKLVILSGAGISKESGIDTFRDKDGMWKKYDALKLASIDGWNEDPQAVLDFYNARRRQLLTVQPNKAHQLLQVFLCFSCHEEVPFLLQVFLYLLQEQL